MRTNEPMLHANANSLSIIIKEKTHLEWQNLNNEEIDHFQKMINSLTIHKLMKERILYLIQLTYLCLKNYDYLKLINRLDNNDELYEAYFGENEEFRDYLFQDNNGSPINQHIIEQVNQLDDISQITGVLTSFSELLLDNNLKITHQLPFLVSMLTQDVIENEKREQAGLSAFDIFAVDIINTAVKAIRIAIETIQNNKIDREKLLFLSKEAKRLFENNEKYSHIIDFIEKIYAGLTHLTFSDSEANLLIRQFLLHQDILTLKNTKWQQVPQDDNEITIFFGSFIKLALSEKERTKEATLKSFLHLLNDYIDKRNIKNLNSSNNIIILDDSDETELLCFLSTNQIWLSEPLFSRHSAEHGEIRQKLDEVMSEIRDKFFNQNNFHYKWNDFNEKNIEYLDRLKELIIKQEDKQHLFYLIHNLFVCYENFDYLKQMQNLNKNNSTYTLYFGEEKLFKHFLYYTPQGIQIHPDIISQVNSLENKEAILEAINSLVDLVESVEIHQYSQFLALRSALFKDLIANQIRIKSGYSVARIDFIKIINLAVKETKETIAAIKALIIPVDKLLELIEKASQFNPKQSNKIHYKEFTALLTRLTHIAHRLKNNEIASHEANLEIRMLLAHRWRLMKQTPWHFLNENNPIRVEFINELASLITTENEALAEIIMPNEIDISPDYSAATDTYRDRLIAQTEQAELGDNNELNTRTIKTGILFDQHDSKLIDTEEVIRRAYQDNDILFSEKKDGILQLNKQNKEFIKDVFPVAYNFLLQNFLNQVGFFKELDSFLSALAKSSSHGDIGGESKDANVALYQREDIKTAFFQFFTFWNKLPEEIRAQYRDLPCRPYVDGPGHYTFQQNVYIIASAYPEPDKLFFNTLTEVEKKHAITTITSCTGAMHFYINIFKQENIILNIPQDTILQEITVKNKKPFFMNSGLSLEKLKMHLALVLYSLEEDEITQSIKQFNVEFSDKEINELFFIELKNRLNSKQFDFLTFILTRPINSLYKFIYKLYENELLNSKDNANKLFETKNENKIKLFFNVLVKNDLFNQDHNFIEAIISKNYNEDIKNYLVQFFSKNLKLLFSNKQIIAFYHTLIEGLNNTELVKKTIVILLNELLTMEIGNAIHYKDYLLALTLLCKKMSLRTFLEEMRHFYSSLANDIDKRKFCRILTAFVPKVASDKNYTAIDLAVIFMEEICDTDTPQEFDIKMANTLINELFIRNKSALAWLFCAYPKYFELAKLIPAIKQVKASVMHNWRGLLLNVGSGLPFIALIIGSVLVGSLAISAGLAFSPLLSIIATVGIIGVVSPLAIATFPDSSIIRMQKPSSLLLKLSIFRFLGESSLMRNETSFWKSIQSPFLKRYYEVEKDAQTGIAYSKKTFKKIFSDIKKYVTHFRDINEIKHYLEKAVTLPLRGIANMLLGILYLPFCIFKGAWNVGKNYALRPEERDISIVFKKTFDNLLAGITLFLKGGWQLINGLLSFVSLPLRAAATLFRQNNSQSLIELKPILNEMIDYCEQTINKLENSVDNEQHEPDCVGNNNFNAINNDILLENEEHIPLMQVAQSTMQPADPHVHTHAYFHDLTKKLDKYKEKGWLAANDYAFIKKYAFFQLSY